MNGARDDVVGWLTRDGLVAAGRRSLVVLTVVLAGAWAAVGLAGGQHHLWLYDFHGGLYNAGKAILNGHNPYHAGFIAHQAAIMRTGGTAIGETSRHAFSLPVYPAPANLAVAALALLPLWLAGTIYTVLCLAAMTLGLRLLRVRDWRCLVLASVSWPFLYGLALGAVGPLLVLGVAVIWRWREKLWPPALALAAVVVAKIFPFPLAAWMLLTRRYRAFALAVVLGVLMTVLSWAVLGFAGMAEYPRMLSNATFIQEGRAESLAALLLAAGAPPGAAQAVALMAAVALLVLAWLIARSPNGQREAFGLAVIACLTASPIVWDHYLVLLFVPIALLSPRYSPLWLVPVAGPLLFVLWGLIAPLDVHSIASDPGNIRRALITVGLEAIVVFHLCRPWLATIRAVPTKAGSAAQPSAHM